MKKQDVIDYFGSVSAAANALEISDKAIYKWRDRVPLVRALELEKITGGELKVNVGSYSARLETEAAS